MKLKELSESTGKSVADLGIDYKGGSFSCSNNELASLADAPSRVDGHFDCSANKLTSLNGAPSHVGAHFYCSHNELTSLVGAPSHVGAHFYCSHNELTSLVGAPSHVGAHFYCSANKLTSLNGAPSHVNGNFDCSLNKLTSLKDVYKHIAEIKGKFYAIENPIKSHVLGLLLIKGVTGVHLDNKQIEEILNKHLGKGRAGMLMAQEELIEAGLEEFAQL